MDKLVIKEFKTKNVTITAAPRPEGIRLNIQGSIDVRNPRDQITEYFNEVHDKIIKSDVRLLEIDITGLSFINSSGIGALVMWLTKISLLPEEKKYKIIVLFNSKIQWQKNGLQVLKQIADVQLVLKDV